MTAENMPKFPSSPRPYTKEEGKKIYAVRKTELSQLSARIEKGSFEVKNERGESVLVLGREANEREVIDPDQGVIVLMLDGPEKGKKFLKLPESLYENGKPLVVRLPQVGEPVKGCWVRGGLEQIPEYNFENGINEAVNRIITLRANLNRDIFVVINGAGQNVGKSKLRSALIRRLIESGIKAEPSLSDINHGSHKVVFFIAENLVYKLGQSYQDYLIKSNPRLQMGNSSLGDFYIGIFRPNKDFHISNPNEVEPVADIMICNEHAKDKD